MDEKAALLQQFQAVVRRASSPAVSGQSLSRDTISAGLLLDGALDKFLVGGKEVDHLFIFANGDEHRDFLQTLPLNRAIHEKIIYVPDLQALQKIESGLLNIVRNSLNPKKAQIGVCWFSPSYGTTFERDAMYHLGHLYAELYGCNVDGVWRIK